jgi:NADH-quinone oxidoreductase subunit L
MGGLFRHLPITFLTFLAGALALIGFPLFSGFYSKDVILALAYERNTAIFAVALGTAFLTAFYILRLVVVVFFAKPRSEAAHASDESPLVMTGPLIVLGLLALIGGYGFFARHFVAIPQEKGGLTTVPAMAITAMVLGSGVAIAVYRNRASEPLEINLLRRGFYIDDLYRWLINWTQELLARIAAFFDRWIIDAVAVRGASGGTWGIGALLRLLQVGNLQAYAFLFGLGIVVLIYFAVFH